MRKLLLSCAALAAMIAPASAAAILHVNDTQGSGGPSDPVLIQSQTQFYVEQTSNGQNTPPPLTLYFLDFPLGIVPTVSSALLNGTTVTPVGTATQLADFTSGDFYKDYLGCGTCSGSISFANIQTAYQANFGVNAPASFDVYAITINGGFDGSEFYEINGIFGKGTIIAPFADTDITTSWTNTGLITGGPCLGCGPNPTVAVPAPIVGAGIPGLITACITMLGLARHRRRTANV